jgi:hypothetical protein
LVVVPRGVYSQRSAGFVKAGIFIADVYKYTEKIERKNFQKNHESASTVSSYYAPTPAFTKPLL